jgi:TetR/AcrR family transcriptional regulator, regulator of biofilm formation and stress response
LSRRQRGERRRQAILDATLTLVGREGAGAITHRAVAEVAGVPLAATTYYFASKAELIREALAHAAASDRRALAALTSALEQATTVEQVASILASSVAQSLGPGRAVVVSHYEICLEAARRPELAEVSRAWTDAHVRALAPTLARFGSRQPARDAWIVVTAIDGMVFDELAGPRPRFVEDILAPRLERLLRSLTR